MLKRILPFFLIFTACHSSKKTSLEYESESLKISALTKNTFVHVTYFDSQTFGKVACNGMIAINDGEALICDTPTNVGDSKELIDWVETKLKCKTVGIVVTHFHADCLGGLSEFHRRGIPSYASDNTIELAKSNNEVVPETGFKKTLELDIGNKKLTNEFIGEGHTRDNIVCYFPEDEVLFGGCLIKSDGAGKGYLGDANTDEWSNTVKKVKSRFNETKVVIPGHGKPGGQKLLDYTIQLFEIDKS